MKNISKKNAEKKKKKKAKILAWPSLLQIQDGKSRGQNPYINTLWLILSRSFSLMGPYIIDILFKQGNSRIVDVIT